MSKLPPPKISESISNMHRELVKRAAIEHPEPGAALPRLDQDPVDAATTYLRAHGASNTVAGTIPPGKSQRIRLEMAEPTSASPTAVLAMALGSLAVYQRISSTIAACERIRLGAESAIAGLNEVTKGLSGLASLSPNDELAWLPRYLDAAETSAEAAPLVTRLIGLVTAIARLYENREFWGQPEDLRDKDQIKDCRHRLMPAFTNREIALMVVDGLGGTIRERSDRVKSQRTAAKKAADGAEITYPHEAEVWLVLAQGSG